jgi:hypothetical protein
MLPQLMAERRRVSGYVRKRERATDLCSLKKHMDPFMRALP